MDKYEAAIYWPNFMIRRRKRRLCILHLFFLSIISNNEFHLDSFCQTIHPPARDVHRTLCYGTAMWHTCQCRSMDSKTGVQGFIPSRAWNILISIVTRPVMGPT